MKRCRNMRSEQQTIDDDAIRNAWAAAEALNV